MGYIWAIYYLYLLTYLLLSFPVRYPGTRRITRRVPKLPGYGSPTHDTYHVHARISYKNYIIFRVTCKVCNSLMVLGKMQNCGRKVKCEIENVE